MSDPLPNELKSAILLELALQTEGPDSLQALCSCSLASSSLHSEAIRHIFAKISISQVVRQIPKENMIQRCQNFLEIMNKNPAIAPAVRSFTLFSRTRYSLGGLVDPFWVLNESALHLILPRLQNVEHAEIREREMLVLWPSVSLELQNAIDRFLASPSVRSLALQNLIHFPISTLFACTSARHLSMSQSTFTKVDLSNELQSSTCPILDTLRLSESGTTLQYLSSPSCPLLSRLKEFHFTIFSLNAFETLSSLFMRTSNTLEHLNLRFIGQLQYFSQEDIPDLGALQNLRTLSLSINCINITKALPAIVTSLLRIRGSQSATVENIEIRVYWIHVLYGMEQEIFQPSAEWEDLDDIFGGGGYPALRSIKFLFSFGFIGSIVPTNEQAVEDLQPVLALHFSQMRKSGVELYFEGNPCSAIWYET